MSSVPRPTGREGGADRIGNLVHGDDARSLVPRHHSNKLLDGLAHGCGCQHDRRLRIAEYGLETLGVSGQLRSEKRDRDVSSLDCGEEARHVFEALRRKDRDPVTRSGHLLQPRTDRL